MTDKKSLSAEQFYQAAVGDYVARLAKSTRDVYRTLYPDNNAGENIAVPVVAEQVCDILATGVLAYLLSLNVCNEKEAALDIPNAPEKFDAITLFMDTLMGRLVGTGQVGYISQAFDPEAFAQVAQACKKSQQLPEDATKQ